MNIFDYWLARLASLINALTTVYINVVILLFCLVVVACVFVCCLQPELAKLF